MKRDIEESKKTISKSVLKKRNWWFVVYPESLPDDWKEILKSSGLPFAISPLHCDDLNPDGEKKKPHYHVIVLYGNPTTFKNVCVLTERLNAPHPQFLDSIKGAYRYLTHKDNPEKAQYNETEIETGNGFCYRDIIEITKSEIRNIVKELTILVNEKKIFEYNVLMMYCIQNLDDDYFEVASSHTIYFQAIISSLRNSRNKNEISKLKEETKKGE